MKIRNRVWATTATLALSLSLAACGDTGGGDADGEGDAGGRNDGVLDVWIAFTDEARLGFAEEKAAEFAEKHGIEVKVTGFDDYETLVQQVQGAFDSGEAPEIVHYFEAATREALDMKDANGDPVFRSISAALDGRDEVMGEPVVLDDVVAPAANYYTIDGEFYSMPWNTSSTIMYGNKTLMDQAGVSEMPETWQDLEAACEQIMALDNAPRGCVTWPNHSWWVEQSMGQVGALLGNNDNGRSGRATEVDLDSPEMVDYLTWWSELENQGHYYYTGVQRDWDGTRSSFAAQEVAFLQSSSGDAAAVVDSAEQGGYEVVADRMPHNGEAEYEGNLIGGATLWLTSGLDEEMTDQALAFLQFFNNTENAAEWHKVSGYIPITESAVQALEEEGWFDENPTFKVASDQLAMAADTPAATGVLMGNFVAIRDDITAAVEEVLVNDADVAERLARADEEAQQRLEEYELLNAEE